MMSPESSSEPITEPAQGGQETENTVEKFDGKILYNPDGSTYIIEDPAELGDNELPKQEGSFYDDAKEAEEDSEERSYPQIANAHVVSRSTAYYNALYGQAVVKMLQERNVPETPVVHSYRVYSARTGSSQQLVSSKEPEQKPSLPSLVPVKPILMCFICKLSFGCAKTFANHCLEVHSVSLSDEEQSILDAKNTSAILQYVGKDQEVTLSFLEPFVSSNDQSRSSPTNMGPPTTVASSGVAGNPLNNLVSLMQNKSSSSSSSSQPPLSPGAIASFLSVVAAAQQAKSSLPKVPTLAEDNKEDSIAVDHNAKSPTNNSFTRYSSPSPSSTSAFPGAALPGNSMTATNANMLQGTTIGACPDHINGRPTGEECTKCDLILSSSRMAGGTGWNVSRNSCKTLKCPKCNWHYKYQETLEIHMKEKHPESETTCIYCITGQQHPRLARGETYTCGYKPYRCEVCNYSTTTKGNLSIHMQSDKHLNNMQELQNGGVPASLTASNPLAASNQDKISPGPSRAGMALPPTMSPSSKTQSPSPKPTWRCDVCNYDTNVARNLRIHMTSEKHTHNMMALSQQNAKMLQQMMQGAAGGSDPSKLLPPLPQPGLLAPPTSSEAALADLAFNQAVLAQMMSGNVPAAPSNDLNLAALMAAAQNQNNPEAAMAAAAAAQHAANSESPEALREKQNQEDQNAKFMFSCLVCNNFGCDTLDELSAHLNIDRSRTGEQEVSLFIGGYYLCQLCNYKTNLKANFQLHCKTDKHLQRLSHVNHIKEGGPSNEWKLRFLSSINPVELRCNATDFVTNSPHKMQVHVASQQYQAAAVLFSHLQKQEVLIEDEEKRSYYCTLCKLHFPSKRALMAHVRTMKHLQMEQIHQLQKKAEGNLIPTEIGDIFQVVEAPTTQFETENSENSKEEFSTAEKGSTSPTATGLGGAGLEGGDEGQESTQPSEQNETSAESGDSPSAAEQQRWFQCPLCSEKFPSQDLLESHAMSVHSVNSEGLQRLQSLINGSHWLNKKEGDNNNLEEEKKAGTSSSSGFSYSLEKYMDPNRPFKCDVCKESFTQKNILLVHYNSVSHLHRLKKSMQDSNSTPEKSASTKSSALEALLGNIRGEKNQEVDEVKPFKCNICRVAYSQGSTLDIHIRSVLHQTKASKLQELMMTGQIDMSKPLIEQPEPQQLQDQHKKMIQDMLLSPKSLNSTGSSNPQTSPNLRSSSPDRLHGGHSSPQSSSPLVNKESSPEVQPQENIMKNLLSNLTSTPNDKEENRPDLKNILQNYVSELKRQRETSEDEAQFSEAKKAREQQQENGDSRPASPPASPQPNPAQQPNLQEMQEALQRAMMGAQLQQMNPMMMQMASLNPLIAMNLYPPLIPPNLLQQKGQAPGGGPGPNSDLLSQLQANPLLGGMDPKLLALMSAAQRQQESPASPVQQAPKNLAQMMGLLNPPPSVSSAEVPNKNFLPPGFPAAPPTFRLPRPEAPGGMILPQQPMGQDQGKRARTRISDDQLKILRANFDINNSPTEDTLNKMSAQTGLPLKVIKHWFRNTLFKERQKNKDSPYNFNNPPSTKLNLEEYEKTGEPKVTPLNMTDQEEYIKQEAAKKLEIEGSSNASKKENNPIIKSESISNASKVPNSPIVSSSNPQSGSVNETISSSSPIEAANSAALSNLSRILGPHLTPGALAGPGGQPPPLLPNFPAFPMTSGSMTPPMPEYLTTLARQNPRPQSPQSVGSGQGKRANRTRFTDYQIKVLQEFFENNAYPKDDDLEYLSKLLGLSPRVIVVWFQNARQKARKIYENQPPPGDANSSPGGGAGGPEGDEASGRFSRTQNCNYQCKKCLLVFQRYYELIRHQKQHCYKEEDARRSAQAQKAAAQAAAQFVGPPPALVPITSEESRSSVGDDRSLTSPALTDKDQEESTPRGTPLLNFPPHTPFGILQQQALQQQQLQQQMNNQNNQVIKENPNADLSGDEFDDFESNASSPGSKRKLSDNDAEIDDETLQHREKRLRTTISPEQLDFLYQKYQMESNPSRKMLETIAAETGLRKRVVQVWFQNTRARERKGQFNGNAMPTKTQDFLKVRSALEAPLGIPKHPVVDNNIVDIEGETENDNENHENNGNNHNQGNGHQVTPGFDLQSSMRKYYEDTMKRFMSDLADQKQQFPSEPHQALDLSSSFNNEDSDPHDDSETSQRNSSSEANNKRFRTQMSGLQVKMMKAIFEAYKTPTMTECSSLGREIGLQKRVVQVWFQNARAKEKRARLQLQQATGREPEPPMPPEECPVCPGFKFGPRFPIQDHLFTKAHLDNLRVALEQGRYDPESPGHAMAQAAAAISQQNGSSPDPQTSLSMLQINQMNNSSPHELFDIPSAKNPRMLMQV